MTIRERPFARNGGSNTTPVGSYLARRSGVPEVVGNTARAHQQGDSSHGWSSLPATTATKSGHRAEACWGHRAWTGVTTSDRCEPARGRRAFGKNDYPGVVLHQNYWPATVSGRPRSAEWGTRAHDLEEMAPRGWVQKTTTASRYSAWGNRPPRHHI